MNLSCMRRTLRWQRAWTLAEPARTFSSALSTSSSSAPWEMTDRRASSPRMSLVPCERLHMSGSGTRPSSTSPMSTALRRPRWRTPLKPAAGKGALASTPSSAAPASGGIGASPSAGTSLASSHLETEDELLFLVSTDWKELLRPSIRSLGGGRSPKSVCSISPRDVNCSVSSLSFRCSRRWRLTCRQWSMSCTTGSCCTSRFVTVSRGMLGSCAISPSRCFGSTARRQISARVASGTFSSSIRYDCQISSSSARDLLLPGPAVASGETRSLGTGAVDERAAPPAAAAAAAAAALRPVHDCSHRRRCAAILRAVPKCCPSWGGSARRAAAAATTWRACGNGGCTAACAIAQAAGALAAAAPAPALALHTAVLVAPLALAFPAVVLLLLPGTPALPLTLFPAPRPWSAVPLLLAAPVAAL
mmetsp:Transcript_40626/g.126645  ORF Transcript_40626/g.126645 Transcript_40626/m.126645 type:complete len:419 (-) Transcript_40626:128-1384(-)